VLPVSLFQPFNSPQAEVYQRLLTELYTESCRATQPLSRALVLDLIIAHNPPANDPLPAARETLRFLEGCGWLQTKVQPDYQQACTLTPHAFQILSTFSAQFSQFAYPQLLISIHDLLKAALLDVDNGDRLQAATHLTDQFLTQLKSLQHNAPTGSAPLADTTPLRAAIVDAAAKLETRGHAPARYIREQFESLDRLLADIAQRQTVRPSAPVQSSSANPQLESVIKHLVSTDKKSFSKLADSLINLYGTSSLQPPNHPTPQPAFIPDDSLWPQPTQAEIAAARREIARQLNRPISPNRVRRLAQTFLANKPFVRAADLVVEGKADLALLVQLRYHATSDLGYTIEDQPWLELNGLVFRDFQLKNPNYVELKVESVIEETTE
jgi:hypothetical protein